MLFRSQSKVQPDRKKSIQSPTGPQQFNPKSYRTAKKSIQSPTGPQKFNPKSYRTAAIQSKVQPDRKNTEFWRKFRIFFYTCHLKDEQYDILAKVSQIFSMPATLRTNKNEIEAKVSQIFYILATLRTTNTKCWRTFRNFFIYLPH